MSFRDVSGHPGGNRQGRERARWERGLETHLVWTGLPFLGQTQAAGNTPQGGGSLLGVRGGHTSRSRGKLCRIPERASASVPGGVTHLAPFHPSQEKHSRLIMLEFLNIQKAVML